jgi:tetraacyldisaccharide 4'-kinase
LLDRLYGHAVRARRRWYERHPAARRRLDAPVISIGNLTVGGAGKTPLVRALAEWLIARGERPSILSRGYARRDRADGAVVVSDGTRVLKDLWQSGDEPLMLARALPAAIVVVAEDRYLAGVVAEQRLGATVHILDDGFQHLRLARDLDVLVTTVGEIGGGRLLPMGRLREPGDAAARAHIVVLIGADADAARTEAWTLGISQHVVARRIVEPPPPGVGPAVAVAGIANPAQFFDALASAGWPISRTMAFRDHHQYGRDDIARIAAAVREVGGTAIVTTEKDAVRFEPLGALPFALTTVPLSLAIDDWATFAGTVTAAIERRRAPAGLDA